MREALSKKSEIGSDIDLDAYESSKEAEVVESLDAVPEDIRRDMVSVGVTSDEAGRGGTFLFIGNSLSHCSNRTQEGLEMITTRSPRRTSTRRRPTWRMRMGTSSGSSPGTT